MRYLNLKRDWLPAILSGLIIGLAVLVFTGSPRQQTSLDGSGYADVIEPVLPFTVSILTNRATDQSLSSLTDDPVLSKYLQVSPNQTNLGSGILISRDGLVVTNAHVVKAATDIVIVSHGGLRASVLSTVVDPETDIALLKTNLQIDSDLPVNHQRSSRIGDLVFTIGNPFGIGQSVSMGIISAKGRHQPSLTTLTDFIQTDAAINPGNSGGALVNIHGEVIGMNSALFSTSGGWQGIGFALPFEQVLAVADELNRQGKVSRGYLGIDVAELQAGDTEAAGADYSGLKIISVAPLSPAERAGIKQGDILLSINDTQLASRTEAARLISALMPNKQTSLTLLRDGKKIRVEVLLASRN